MMRFPFSDSRTLRIAHKVGSQGRPLLLRVVGNWIEVETTGDDYWLGAIDAGPVAGAVRSVPADHRYKIELSPRASMTPIHVRKSEDGQSIVIEANPDAYDARPVFASTPVSDSPARQPRETSRITPRISPPPGSLFAGHINRKRN